MERWPVIITIGAALLGLVAGEMLISDPVVKDWVDANAAWLHYAGPVAGAVFVVAVGKWLAKRRVEAPVELDDLATNDAQPAARASMAAPPTAGGSPAAQPESWRR